MINLPVWERGRQTINIKHQQQEKHAGLVAKFHGLQLSTGELFFLARCLAGGCVSTSTAQSSAIRDDISEPNR